MPTSTWIHTSTIGDLMYKYQPKSILDIGVGFGRWGMLAREVLEVIKGRPYKENWQVKITGVEIFADYIKDYHRYFYDKIIVGNADHYLQSIAEENFKFDMIIAGDVIEHFEKEKAKKVIDNCLKICKILIVCIPFGDKYPQGKVYGNEYETHKSVWNADDFKDKRVVRVLELKERVKGRPYGVILYEA